MGQFVFFNRYIVFQNYRNPKYSQLHGAFVSHLSVVDLLFNCGPDSLAVLMSGNVTKDDLIRENIRGRREQAVATKVAL